MNSHGKNYYEWIIISLIVLLLAACSPQSLAGETTDVASNSASSIIPSLAPTAIPLELLPSVTPHLLPTLTPSLTPSPTPTNFFTATPTETPVPTSTVTTCTEPGTVEIGYYFSAIAGQDKTYRIYLPPCYGQNGRFYPTLYMFHGNIDTDVKWDELGLDEAAENAILADELPPFLIVMPDGGWIANNSSGGPYSFEGIILNELIPAIEATYCAWPEPDGRAIGGLSRGGYWSLEIAFRNPEIFSSVGGHSPALIDIAAGPNLDPIYTWEYKDLSRLRIYIDIGENDYLRAKAVQLHDRLTAGGIQHDWSLNEGGHEDVYWESRVNEYLTWYAQLWPKESETYSPCNTAMQ